MSNTQMIPFIDLQTQRKRLGDRLETAIHKVLEHGGYIMGPEVAELERQLAIFCGAKHAISCSNGTDALALVLRAKGVQTGDAILVPSFTFAATAEVVLWLGATPVFVDVLPDTYNMDPKSLELGIAKASSLGLTPRGVICVDLFGQPADYEKIEAICQHHKLWLMCDGAQSFGAHYKGRAVGTIGMATTTSFYPAKPLGCYGDGGAIFTNDDELAAVLKSIRVHGQGSNKYENVRVGINGRLDTIQAAILIEKLSIFPEEISERQTVAQHYHQKLKSLNERVPGLIQIPYVLPEVTSVWAQYTIRLNQENLKRTLGKTRAEFMKLLESIGIPTVIHYPKPLHRQLSFQNYPCADDLSVSEKLAEEVLSLPMHPYLSNEMQQRIFAGLSSVLEVGALV